MAILQGYMPFLNGQVTNKPIDGSQPPSLNVVGGRPSGAYPSNMLVNYIKTREAVAPINSLATFNLQDYLQVKEQWQYLDGLGRPLQMVNRQATPGNSPKDLVAPVTYDDYGRETFKYLPYAQLMGTNQDNGHFKNDPFSDLVTYYTDGGYNQNGGTAGEQAFFGKTEYEGSSLNRVAKVFAPGNSWVGTQNQMAPKAVRMEYHLNATEDAVRIWQVSNDPLTYDNEDIATNIPVSTSTYGPAQLFKNITIDEQGRSVIEYKDKAGQVILKKVQLDDDISNQPAHAGWLCTYYVYDNFGQVRFIIPPKAVEQLDISYSWDLTANPDIINELCFRYEYDARNRMLAKKLPGAGWVYLVTDPRDRLSFSQDANMRVNNQWMTVLYDAFNRPIGTGITTFAGTRTELQYEVDKWFNPNSTGGGTVSFGIPNSTATYDIQVQNNPIPSTSSFVGLTLTYFDSYAATAKTYSTINNNKLDDGGNSFAEALPAIAYNQIRGLVTVTKTRVLENPSNLAAGDWLEAVSFYDEKGRPIQQQAVNYKNGTDIITSRYDFSGKLLTTYMVHSNPEASSASISQKTNLLYDHAGRLLQVTKTLNDDPATTRLIVRNQYDAMGQLLVKQLGQKKDAGGTLQTAPMETLNYGYNIRGWLKYINRDYNAGNTESPNYNRWFGMELSYDHGFEHNQFNGNIAGITWRSKGDGERRAYGFGYDNVNRLNFGDFNQRAGSNWDKSANIDFSMHMGEVQNIGGVDKIVHAYDANGNILKMWQMGLKLTASSVIDNLSYNYADNSNKLLNVLDAANDPTTKLGDFRTSQQYLNAIGAPKDAGARDYRYDLNGNLLVDLNKDIVNDNGDGGILYNHLNLPYSINSKEKGTVTYIYDAAGNKLEKRTRESTSTSPGDYTITYTSYLAGFVYEHKDITQGYSASINTPRLQYLPHEEGKIRPLFNSSNAITGFAYDYFIKDHLGNVRVVLTDEQKSDLYRAGFEDANASFEGQLYTNYINRVARPACFQGGDSKVQFVGAAAGTRNSPVVKTVMGAGKVLKVMSGDHVTAAVRAMFSTGANSQDPNTLTPIQDLILAMFSQGIVSTGAEHGGFTTGNGSLLSTGVADFLSTQPNYSSSKAYLNWILLDEEQFKLVSSGSGFESVAEQVAMAPEDCNSTVLMQANEGQGIDIEKNGYLYIYVSNTSTDHPVYFDDLNISHIRGPLQEETHYYPFGLTMAGISSKAAGGMENKKKYQQYEYNSDFDINLYESFYRSHDPQLGRWWQMDPKPKKFESPYTTMGNNPISNIDLLGDIFRGVNKTSADRTLKLLQQTFSCIEGADALTQLFSISDDGVTFNRISSDAFKKAIEGLDEDAQALAQGYYDLITSTELNFSAVINSDNGEKLDFSQAKEMSDDQKKSQAAWFAQFDGGATHPRDWRNDGIVVAIDLASKVVLKDVEDLNGKSVNYKITPEAIMAHEALGHGLSSQYNATMSQKERQKLSQQNAIQAENLFYRATGTPFYRNGANHNKKIVGQEVPMDKKTATAIPAYLKPAL